MEEWQLPAMRDAIDRSLALLDTMTAQAHQDDVDKKIERTNIVLVVVALLTLITVIDDTIKFISEHPEHMFYASLLLLGPSVILLFLYLRRYDSNR